MYSADFSSKHFLYRHSSSVFLVITSGYLSTGHRSHFLISNLMFSVSVAGRITTAFCHGSQTDMVSWGSSMISSLRICSPGDGICSALLFVSSSIIAKTKKWNTYANMCMNGLKEVWTKGACLFHSYRQWNWNFFSRFSMKMGEVPETEHCYLVVPSSELQ